MHRLPRRQSRNPPDCRRSERLSAIRAGQATRPILNRRNPDNSRSSANPTRAYTQWLNEDWNYIRFVNPGDLRVAEKTCGTSGCHTAEVRKVQTSMMTHGAMLWGAALYNNGAFPLKTPRFGESYGPDGTPQRLLTFPPPTPEEISRKGVLPFLDPLQRWEISQPGNVLRVFERGSEKKPEVGNPSLEEEPGKPEIKLSDRGFGTELRTDPVFLGLQKTRLLDPLLSFPGTNDQPGDYRASGCSACHVVYANDRSPEHSGAYAASGQSGTDRHRRSHHSAKRIRPSHPPPVHALDSVQPVHGLPHASRHEHGRDLFRLHLVGQRNGWRAHVPAAAAQSQRAEQRSRSRPAIPKRSAVRGLWSDPEFLREDRHARVQPASCKHTQFADFHGHGWVFRAVFKHDRKGNLLDKDDKKVDFKIRTSSRRRCTSRTSIWKKGMHCIDCHFEQDSHGNGKLYGETAQRGRDRLRRLPRHHSQRAPR